MCIYIYIYIYIHTRALPFSQWEKEPHHDSNRLCCREEHSQFGRKYLCQGKPCLKERKKCPYLVLPEKCTEQQEETLLKNSHSFLAAHLSSNSTRTGNLKVVLEKDHFSTEMRTQH